MELKDLIDRLGLIPHEEGGYFRQMYQADWTVEVPGREGSTRLGLSTIHYLLTREHPIGHFHRNRSDIVHFFHLGGPMEYLLVSPDGRLEQRILGPSLEQGHLLQMTVPGGYWKASRLMSGDFGLLSEAVGPGFDARDRELATPEQFRALFPDLWPRCAALVGA